MPEPSWLLDLGVATLSQSANMEEENEDEDEPDLEELWEEGQMFVDEYELDDTYASFLGPSGEEQIEADLGQDPIEGVGLFGNGCIVA